ncbi:putative Fe-containing alcohol dehydrogenase [Xylariaceae sp. FL1651]|nr:putative Fe-containing alcohol dehydrogenase [Xylariaceae sp. FL1651]
MSETCGRAFPDAPTPLLSYGLPFTRSLLRHANDTFHTSKLYVICSGSLAKNTSYLDDLRQQLGDKLVGTRVGMRSHSLWSEILEVVEDVTRCEADCIVTLGAGSLTDAAKIASFAVANSVSTTDALESLTSGHISKRSSVKPSKIPVICIPTTLSGGEYSSFAGATKDADGRKYQFTSPGLKGPSLVILDPELATTTPDSVWLSTGVRALDHCIEALCSLQSNNESDDAARHGLGQLVPGLLRCKENPKDLEARLECFLGSRDAMSAVMHGVPLGASHGIGHQLGPAGVGHGETSCILNPAVCKYNYIKKANVERQDAIVKILWKGAEASAIFEKEGLKRESAELGDLMDAIIRALGMPRTLKEFGIGEDKLDGIAEHSLKDKWVQTNPAPLDKEGVLEILRSVLE